eukprot:365930-Chlamydomonas_euryale.AAC.28
MCRVQGFILGAILVIAATASLGVATAADDNSAAINKSEVLASLIQKARPLVASLSPRCCLSVFKRACMSQLAAVLCRFSNAHACPNSHLRVNGLSNLSLRLLGLPCSCGQKKLDAFHKELSGEGLDVNQPTKAGQILLIEAVKTKKIEFVDPLIQVQQMPQLSIAQRSCALLVCVRVQACLALL